SPLSSLNPSRYWRTSLSELSSLFKCKRKLQHVEITLTTTDNLQSDRESIVRKTTRDGDRGQAGQCYGVTGSHPINITFHLDAIDLPDPGLFDRKRRYLRHGQDQEFILLHKRAHAMIKLGTVRLGAGNVCSAQLESLFDIPDDGVLHQRAMLFEIIAFGLRE